MRSRLAHAAVFIGVFCLFLGYCEWWKSNPETTLHLATQSPPAEAYLVEGADDDSFNGVYLPTAWREGRPCFMKETPPARYLWQGDTRWHLSTVAWMAADAYVTEIGCSPSSRWLADGAADPAPTVVRLPEFPAGHIRHRHRLFTSE